MDRGQDAVKRKRLDSSAPPSKREKLNSTQAGNSQVTEQPSNAEGVRSTVREIFKAYNTLAVGDAPSSAQFNTLLQASAGDLASQRLAARLLPRFITKVPGLVETAASALIRLHSQQHAYDDHSLIQLAVQARTDAIHGLAAVLKAAQACTDSREAAVRMVLDYLFRLLPQAAAIDEPSEPEEEGEVAACHSHTACVPFLHKLLSEALHLHPAITMGHCAACLVSACRPSSNSNSCSQSEVQAGVRLWLQEHLLKDRSPSREGTPQTAGDLTATFDAAAAAAAAGGVDGGRLVSAMPLRGCLLQDVLDTSEELQAWIMQQARSRAAAPPEVRSVIEVALQLLPGDRQLVAAKPRIGYGPAGAAAAGESRCTQQQQQQLQRLKTANSFPRYQQQLPDNIGFVNGVEQLHRSLSNSTSLDRDRDRAGHGCVDMPAPGTEVWPQFPPVAGPICLAEACLLVLHLPQHVSQQEVKQALGADEAWLIKKQGGGIMACCTFKGVLDAAKCYLRHNGAQRLGPHCPAFKLAFADRLPAASVKATDPGHQPSAYVWATRDAVGDAQSITDELRAAGMQLSHVHRVNNAAEPGTLLQTPSATQAASVVDYLLKKHPQPQQQQAVEQLDEQELPPLPPEPPPGQEWKAGRPQQQQGGVPPLPPGPVPNLQQQQQQLERAATAGVAGRPASPALPRRPQQQGYADGGVQGGMRSAASPAGCAAAAATGSGWRDSPGEWTGHGRRRQQLPSPGVPPPAPPPLPTAQQPIGQPGMSPGGSSWHPAQQQSRWGPLGSLRGGVAAGPMPPTAPHPSTLPLVAVPPPGAPHPGGAAFVGQVPAHTMPAQAQQPRQGSMQLPVVGCGSHAFRWTAFGGNSPAAVHVQQQQPPGPAGFRSAALGRVMWQGAIVKQSVHMCGVVCLPITAVQGNQHMAGLAPEPCCWPDQLHVNFRISVSDVVEQYAHTPADQRAIRMLLPLDPDSGGTQQLQQFINYLNGKERAGMVKLPALREHGLGPRAVYLIVPKLHVCQQLQVAWDGRDVMLIAVVVPQPGTPAGGHGGASGVHRQYRG